MPTSPARHPAVLAIALIALGGCYAARESDPVTGLVLERIEARYISDRAACTALQGPERKACAQQADLRQQIAQQELMKLKDLNEMPAQVAALGD